MTTWVGCRRSERRTSLQWVGALVLTLGCISTAAAAGATVARTSNSVGGGSSPAASSAAGNAADIDQGKAKLIRALIDLTDTSQVKALFSQQLIDRVSSALSMFGPTLSPQTLGVIQQQTRAVVSEHIADGDALYSVLAPVYAKHFNLLELNQLVQFYQSPLGQKLVRTSPELLSETLELGSQWGLSLVPEIVQRVRTRLNSRNASDREVPASP